MQEKRRTWARWLFLMVVGAGLVLAANPGKSQSQKGATVPFAGLFGSGTGEQVKQVLERVLDHNFVDVQLFTVSEDVHQESTQHRPSPGLEQRVLVGRQYKEEKCKKGEYSNITSVDKWKTVNDEVKSSTHSQRYKEIKVVVWTREEPTLEQINKVNELLEFCIGLDRSRGDGVRFELSVGVPGNSVD